MAIKKLTFSFEVPITQLLGLIATGNTGLKIDVLGDDKVHSPKLLNGAHPAMKLLEGPKPHGNAAHAGKTRQRGKDAHGNPITAYNAMLKALAKHPGQGMALADLRPIVGDLGLAPSSANSQISLMVTRGHAKRVGEGTYALTTHGVSECRKRGLPVHERKKKDKPAKPPKAKKKAAPKVEPAPAPEAQVTEVENG